MKTGKKTTAITTAWLLSVPVIPNQALKMGARATMGVALTTTASGVSPSSRVRKRVVTKASATPAMMPISRPLTAIHPVSHMAWRRTGQLSTSSSMIDVGLGNRNSRIPNPLTNASQSRRPTTPTVIGGPRTAIRPRSRRTITRRPLRPGALHGSQWPSRRRLDLAAYRRCAHLGQRQLQSGYDRAVATRPLLGWKEKPTRVSSG